MLLKSVASAVVFLSLGISASAAPETVPAEVNPYDPLRAIQGLGGNGGSLSAETKPLFSSDEKKRNDTFSVDVAGEYFWDFGSDLPRGTGRGISVAGTAQLNSDTRYWDILASLEFLGLSAESGLYRHKDREVKESLQSVNLIFSFGLSRTFYDRFSASVLVGLGMGLTYGEVKGVNFKTSSSGNYTTTISVKPMCEFRFNENWSIFGAYRFAYISPSIASKVAGWHNLDLFTQSAEVGLRYRF